jgi:enterochelin esterase-like enzyme
VQAIHVPSPTLHYDIDALLYLPPCYNSARAYYPVLYLIHGLNYKEDQWDRLGAPAAADALTAAGEIAPLIIVMPRDRLDPRFDPAFVTDLVPYIDQHYRTRPYREFRAIGGLSRGGGWAIHLGLRYPDLFSRIGAHSPAVFYGDDANVLQWARHLPAGEFPVVYEDIGDNDSLGRSAAWLDQVLTWFAIPHTYRVQPGAHTESYWSAHVTEYLRFYAADWRAAVPTPVPDSNP